MTSFHHPHPSLVYRFFNSPPVRVLVLGFILVMMMGLNTDVMTSYAGDPGKSVKHVVALAIAGFAVYLGHAHFIEHRHASELALPGMGREFGVGLLIGAGHAGRCSLHRR
jgi:hypothetical protein